MRACISSFNLLCSILLAINFGCSTKKSIHILKHKLPPNSNIAIIIDSPNNIKNVVLARFMKKKFQVKAINASDLYNLGDIYDIKDFKRVSYESSLKNSESLLTMEKTFDNIYKLHIYNFEVHKAQIFDEMKEKWNLRYLIILDLKDWEHVSWGRVIDLNTKEIIWLENYPTRFKDTLESVVDHFILSMTGL